jgi:hypothetical protein
MQQSPGPTGSTGLGLTGELSSRKTVPLIPYIDQDSAGGIEICHRFQLRHAWQSVRSTV